MISNIYKSLILVALCAFAASCNVNEKIENSKNTDEFKLSFEIGGDNTQTKAAISAEATVSEPIDLSEESGISGLTLTDEVASMDELYAPMTKGTPVYTENFNNFFNTLDVDVYSGNSIWKGLSNVAFNYESDADNGGKIYSHDFKGTGIRWPEDGKLLLFVKAVPSGVSFTSGPSFDPSTSNTGAKGGSGKGTITFGYSDPGAGATGNSAELQKDILFSSKLIQNGSTENKILLYHALTGVKFKVKFKEGQEVKITNVTSVKFSNVISAGTCTIKPTFEGYSSASNKNADRDKSDVTAVWTYGETPARASFSQTFSGLVSYSKTDNTNKFAESFYTGTSAADNLNNASCSQTFLFIPQELTDDVTLTITYKYTDGITTGEKTATTTIDFGTKLKNGSTYFWKAGELHTYTLSLGDTVDVEIDDAVNATTKKKSDLKISNEGTATVYLRVAAIGNWYTNAEAITDASIPVAITPCPELANLVYDAAEAYGSIGTNGKWFKEGDYYYYKYPVSGGKTIKAENTLFGELDLSSLHVLKYWPSDGEGHKKGELNPNGSKPYEECHLEMTLAVQGVRAAQVADAWGNTVAGQLITETTID